MKKILILSAVTLTILFGCKNKEQASEVTTRDTSITPANAYNNFFIDSNKVEAYIAAAQVGEPVAKAIRSFYNARNYQYAWFSNNGLTEQALGFRTLYKYDDTTANNKKLEKGLDALMNEDSATLSPTDSGIVNMELQLTQRFVRYILGDFKDSRISPKELAYFVPAKKMPLAKAIDSLLKDKGNIDKAAFNNAYTALKKQVGVYAQIAKKGGWPVIPESSKPLKPGDNSPIIPLVKKRLAVAGAYNAADTTAVFNPELAAAIQKMQPTLGFDPDGKIDQALIKALNIPVQERLKQLLVNLERMRWIPEVTEGRLAMVNIPAFYLTMYQGKDTAFTMRVVVGKEGNSTTLFYGEMNQVVFSPYWNIPSSIVKKEILPGIERNADYLEQHNMEKTEDGNYRQKPGGSNSLGKVKFLFPNSFSIYFHDTPNKNLFMRENRAYSHGCIRLQDPAKMANYVLKDQPEWTPEKITEAMDKGEEKFVKIKEPIPVIIAYYTAWVDAAGNLNFRNDIYGHDAAMSRKLFLD